MGVASLLGLRDAVLKMRSFCVSVKTFPFFHVKKAFIASSSSSKRARGLEIRIVESIITAGDRN